VAYNHLYVVAPRFLNFDYNGPWAVSGDLGVYFFFALSGFIITWMHLRDLGKPDRLIPFALKRVVRIYPMVWVIVTVKLASAFLIPALNVSNKTSPATITASYLLVPNAKYVIDVQWTLVHEILFYSLFAGWIFLGRRTAAIMGVAWATLILCSPASPDHILLRYFLSPHNLEFLGGALIAVLLSRSLLSARLSAILVPLALAAVVIGIPSGIRTHLFWAPVFCVLLAGMVSFDALGKLRWPRWLTYLGDASYSVYLCHTSFQVLIVLVGRKWEVPFSRHGQLLLHLTGFVSLLGGVACYQWLERPITAWSRRLLSRRGLLVKAPVH
jgi:peptidoglycan/LPS O-acetylase OafA/YrhL